ncbi:uncharacterized protein TM35_000192250 [Trypanosoma theileri]|uniref:Transmembrane protein 138 n=1 Tax=Trypanosoma theileri TaxID=67003 RepID=A0A1X0NTP5_9TRYP|nr:uncharacterized protein TM35_000192250 [Trypanosoma theileri]ORC87981.1 hypothetical protein TM35_000192250 [Trypanosoma theileri]
MGFRLSFCLILLLMLSDLTLVSIRASVYSPAVVYVLLALHEAVLLTLALLLGSFVVHTRWALVGPLRDAFHLLRVIIPLWILRVVFTFLPTLYRIVVLQDQQEHHHRRAWSDVWYGVLFSLNIIIFIAFSLALLHAICFLSEKTLYTPYVHSHPSRISSSSSLVVGGSVSGPSELNSNPLERPVYEDAASHPCDVSSLAFLRTSHNSDRQRSLSLATPQERRRLRY